MDKTHMIFLWTGVFCFVKRPWSYSNFCEQHLSFDKEWRYHSSFTKSRNDSVLKSPLFVNLHVLSFEWTSMLMCPRNDCIICAMMKWFVLRFALDYFQINLHMYIFTIFTLTAYFISSQVRWLFVVQQHIYMYTFCRQNRKTVFKII